MMIEELSEMIANFSGKPNQTQCFTHVLNLIAKTIIKQFNALTKAQKGSSRPESDEEVLEKLVEGMDMEEFDTQLNAVKDKDDNMDGWIDKAELLEEDKQEKLNADVLPIRLIITKVRLCKSMLAIN
jgi:hypothetical protein